MYRVLNDPKEAIPSFEVHNGRDWIRTVLTLSLLGLPKNSLIKLQAKLLHRGCCVSKGARPTRELLGARYL